MIKYIGLIIFMLLTIISIIAVIYNDDKSSKVDNPYDQYGYKRIRNVYLLLSIIFFILTIVFTTILINQKSICLT